MLEMMVEMIVEIMVMVMVGMMMDDGSLATIGTGGMGEGFGAFGG